MAGGGCFTMPFAAVNWVHSCCDSSGSLQYLACPFVPGYCSYIGDMKYARDASANQLENASGRVNGICRATDFIINNTQSRMPVRSDSDLSRKMITARSKQPTYANEQVTVQMAF